MTAVDHILAAALALACLSQLFLHIDPERHTRFEFYQAGMLTALLFGAIPLLCWWAAGRPLAGFGLHGWHVGGTGSVLAGAGWAAMLLAVLLLVHGGVLRRWLAGIYRRYAWIMPRSRAELAASWAASVAAGAGEEIAFRGFLLWYAIGSLGTPAGLIATSLLFGCAHGYQKAAGVAYAAVAGLVLGVAYLASGSLFLVVWMHASWNVASFAVGRLVLAGEGTGGGGRVPL